MTIFLTYSIAFHSENDILQPLLTPSEMDQPIPTIPHCISSLISKTPLNKEGENNHDWIPKAMNFQKMYNTNVLFGTQEFPKAKYNVFKKLLHCIMV